MSVKLISPKECHQRTLAGTMLEMIDVRTPAEFEQAHITGAVSIPLDKLNPAAIASRRNGSAEPLYMICQAGARADKACQMLMAAGITEVYSIDGGTEAWTKLGLPITHGKPRIISLERQVRIGAGFLVLLGLILAWTISPWFLGLTAFIGAGLTFAGITNFCGMALILARMPWNQGSTQSCDTK